MNRLIGLAIASLLAGASSAQAAETIYIGAHGGSTQKFYESTIIPAFEAKTGAKVVYVPGNSSDTLAKLMSQKAKQEISLALIDDGMMNVAVEQGLCAPLPEGGNLKDLYPAAKLPGGKAVGTGMYAVGLAYNKAVFAKKGWKAPTSWNDLADPKFKGQVSIGSIGSYGQFALVSMARVNGGSEENIEPGFQVMSKKVAPNVLVWESSPANIAQLLQTGEAPLVVWGNQRVQAVIDQGAPVEFVYPKEGAGFGMVAVCVVAGAPQPKLAQEFMQLILSPEIQAAQAKISGHGPVNRKTKLDAEVAKRVVYGPEKAESLVPFNWTVMNRDRAEWTKRWNREVER